jgi:hypothetical protein
MLDFKSRKREQEKTRILYKNWLDYKRDTRVFYAIKRRLLFGEIIQ